MESGIPSAGLHEMNGQNRHNLRRVHSGTSVRQQVRDYKRANRQPGMISKLIDSAMSYELIGSIAAIAVVSSVFAVVIR